MVDFLTVGNRDLLLTRTLLFALFLFAGLLISYIYSYLSSSLIHDRNLRTSSYKFKITDAKEIIWEFKDFYQSSFDETQIANVSKKQVNLGSDLQIYLKQGFLPAFNKEKAYAESKNIIIVNNKELKNKTTVPIDINKIWFFTLEKSHWKWKPVFIC